ncbi:MAG TPA: GGDEF domain-containing protein [Clostridia bacterium]
MENYIIDMNQLKQSMSILKQIFDTVRLVCPLSKKLLNVFGETRSNSCCYDIWKHKKACSNCISMRSYQENETHFKLEHNQGRIYMIMAVPVQVNEEILILELIKDITNSLMLDSLTSSNINHPLIKLLDDVKQLQTRDALTGVFNRKFIDERLPVDIYNSNANSKSLSTIMTDIDRFKLVNDTYGHVAGDFILKEFARILHSTIPKDGWVARYGGEEFIIVLLNTDHNQAAVISENIRSKVERNDFIYDGNTIKITSSFGVCTFNNTLDLTVTSLIEFTDKNLYKAKSDGRNRVVASKIG